MGSRQCRPWQITGAVGAVGWCGEDGRLAPCHRGGAVGKDEIDQNSLQTMMAGGKELQDLDETLREEKEFQASAP